MSSIIEESGYDKLMDGIVFCKYKYGFTISVIITIFEPISSTSNQISNRI